MLTEYQLKKARDILGNNYVIVPLENWNAEVERTKQLEKALEFYAGAKTFDIEHLSKHGYILIDRDGGKVARQALGKEE